jgi:hypothetical protein
MPEPFDQPGADAENAVVRLERTWTLQKDGELRHGYVVEGSAGAEFRIYSDATFLYARACPSVEQATLVAREERQWRLLAGWADAAP